MIIFYSKERNIRLLTVLMALKPVWNATVITQALLLWKKSAMIFSFMYSLLAKAYIVINLVSSNIIVRTGIVRPNLLFNQ